jgi:hypothetical protein
VSGADTICVFWQGGGREISCSAGAQGAVIEVCWDVERGQMENLFVREHV